MHSEYSSSHPVSLQRNCIKITSFWVKRFSSWRTVKHSEADFADFKADTFSTFPEATKYKTLVSILNSPYVPCLSNPVMELLLYIFIICEQQLYMNVGYKQV